MEGARTKGGSLDLGGWKKLWRLFAREQESRAGLVLLTLLIDVLV